MSNIPQPRYSKENREQAIAGGRPLFTLDIYWPKTGHGIRRTTVTGVLSDFDAEEAVGRIKRALEQVDAAKDAELEKESVAA